MEYLSSSLVQHLTAFLDMDVSAFLRAYLADQLPTATTIGGDLAALTALEPLSVACGNQHKAASFHARLERAARYAGLASAEQYVSQLVHLHLWSDEREMVIHPQTGKAVGTEAEWSELRRYLENQDHLCPLASAA